MPVRSNLRSAGEANLNLLEQAKASGIRKFIYVSILDGEKLRKVSLCAAKERFVEALKTSGLEYTVVRPNTNHTN